MATQILPERRRSALADSATLENQCHPRKIFIGGLAHKTTTQQLRDYFSRYGDIVDAVVLRWPDGRSRGFGYVTFSDTAAVAAAMRVSHQMAGRHMDVKRAVPGTNKLFVGGLPQNTSAAELREYFEAFGVVSDAVVMIDPVTGRSRGFGFVCYLPGQEGAAAVVVALEQYNNHRIRGWWIEVKSAASPHKLAAKEGWGGPQDGASASASTAAGTCDESQAADSESESAGVNRGPIANARPVASPHGRRLVKPHQLSGRSPHTEPCKVSLPLTTTAARQQSALATMGTPPGLAVPSRATDLLPDLQPEFSLLPCEASWPPARPGLMPWPASCMPVMSMHRHMLSFEPVSARPWCPSFDSSHAQPTVTPDATGWRIPFLQDDGSLLATRHSLQKSLEQLLRQQSLGAAGEKVDSSSTEIRASTAIVPSDEGLIHSGPR